MSCVGQNAAPRFIFNYLVRLMLELHTQIATLTMYLGTAFWPTLLMRNEAKLLNKEICYKLGIKQANKLSATSNQKGCESKESTGQIATKLRYKQMEAQSTTIRFEGNTTKWKVCPDTKVVEAVRRRRIKEEVVETGRRLTKWVLKPAGRSE